MSILTRATRSAVFTWGFLVLLLALWQAMDWLGLLSQRLLPSPLSLITAAGHMLSSKILLRDAAASLLRVLAGFSIAAALGIALGTSLYIFPTLALQLRSTLDLLRPIPPIAWIPLAILWFGIGDTSAIFIVALAAFFPIFVSTFESVALVPSAYINIARSFGADRRLLWTDIVLPAAMPQILTGLRVGLGTAWASVIAAELVGAQSGLGYLIQLNRLLLQTDNVIVGMLTIGLLGSVINRISYKLQRTLLPWTQAAPITRVAPRQ